MECPGLLGKHGKASQVAVRGGQHVRARLELRDAGRDDGFRARGLGTHGCLVCEQHTQALRVSPAHQSNQANS